MGSYKVNYSELVTALQDHKQGRSNQLLKQLLPNLKTYLTTVMNAEPEEAEEAVHRAFLNTYERIMTDKIENRQFIYKYLMSASRHEYVRLKKHNERFSSITTEINEMKATPAKQLNNLIDEDRQRTLKSCLQELPRKKRIFINYILNNPDIATREISEHFNISEVSVRVKKMRIIENLSQCVKKKWEE